MTSNSLPEPREKMSGPFMWLKGAPKEDRDTIRDVGLSLDALASQVNEVGDARALFVHASTLVMERYSPNMKPEDVEALRRTTRICGPWKMLAARAGCMAILEFSEVVKHSVHLTRKSDWLMSRVDWLLLRESNRMYDAAFPKIAGLRNMAAHQGTNVANPTATKKHSVDGDVNIPGLTASYATGLHVQNLLVEETFSGSVNGEMVSYDISEKTVDTLAEICTLRFAAYPN